MSALLRSPSAAPAHRPMQVADLDAVLAIEHSAYAVPWTRGNFVDSLASGYWTALRHEPPGQLAGYAVAMAAVDEMHLLNLTVAPPLQGRGHARGLLDLLQAHARAQRLRSLWLEVRVSNTRAQRLYRAYGFGEVGLRRGYYPAAHGGREDALVMNLALRATAGDGLD